MAIHGASSSSSSPRVGLSESEMVCVGVPPLEERRRAPYFGGLDDPFWVLYEAPPHLKFSGDGPLLLGKEASELEAEAIPCDGVLRLRIEWGDFHYCPSQYVTSAQPPIFWPEWVADMKGSEDIKRRLEHLGLFEAVEICAQLALSRSPSCLDSLVGRSNLAHHTFVARWGEFTPTLEGVAVLLRLPIRGERLHDIHHLTNAERDVERALKEFHSESTHRGTR